MEPSEFADYYDQYKDKIYSYLYYRTGRNRPLAEDLASEVFLKALEKFHTYRPESSFQSWIYAIAHNHLVDHFRKTRTTIDLEEVENVLPGESDPRSTLMKRVAAEEVAELLQYLSDEEREIILMRYHAELPTKDIADIVDKPDATVRVALHRTLAKLRQRYASLYA